MATNEFDDRTPELAEIAQDPVFGPRRAGKLSGDTAEVFGLNTPEELEDVRPVRTRRHPQGNRLLDEDAWSDRQRAAEELAEEFGTDVGEWLI